MRCKSLENLCWKCFSKIFKSQKISIFLIVSWSMTKITFFGYFLSSLRLIQKWEENYSSEMNLKNQNLLTFRFPNSSSIHFWVHLTSHELQIKILWKRVKCKPEKTLRTKREISIRRKLLLRLSNRY